MTSGGIKVEMINLDTRTVMMSDGAVLEIVDFFDDDGDECEPRDATSCVAEKAGYGSLTIDIYPEDEACTVH